MSVTIALLKTKNKKTNFQIENKTLVRLFICCLLILLLLY